MTWKEMLWDWLINGRINEVIYNNMLKKYLDETSELNEINLKKEWQEFMDRINKRKTP